MVMEQIFYLVKTSVLQRSLKEDNPPDLPDWVYGLKNGIINPVFEMEAGTHIDPLYEYDGL